MPSAHPTLTPTTNNTNTSALFQSSPSSSAVDLTALWVVLGILGGCLLLFLLFFLLKKRQEKKDAEAAQYAAQAEAKAGQGPPPGGGVGGAGGPPPASPEFDVEKAQEPLKRDRDPDAPLPAEGEPAGKRPAPGTTPAGMSVDTTDAGGASAVVMGSASNHSTSLFMNPERSGKYRPAGAEPSLFWGGIGSKSPEQEPSPERRRNSERFTEHILPDAVVKKPPPVPVRLAGAKAATTKAAATDEPTTQEIDAMSVKELKRFIFERGGDPSMEVEKSALRQRARDMLFDEL
jgi:hypothetical protein